MHAGRSAGFRAYERRSLGFTFAFGVIVAAMAWLRRRGVDPSLLAWMAWLPALPLGFGLHAWLRYLPTLDELEQRIELRALAFAAGITVALCPWLFSLQAVQVVSLDAIDALAVAVVCPCITYLAARLLIARHFR